MDEKMPSWHWDEANGVGYLDLKLPEAKFADNQVYQFPNATVVFDVNTDGKIMGIEIIG